MLSWICVNKNTQISKQKCWELTGDLLGGFSSDLFSPILKKLCNFWARATFVPGAHSNPGAGIFFCHFFVCCPWLLLAWAGKLTQPFFHMAWEYWPCHKMVGGNRLAYARGIFPWHTPWDHFHGTCQGNCPLAYVKRNIPLAQSTGKFRWHLPWG